MALTTRTLPAIHNGISRQPAILRSFDQTDDEINTWGQIATGVARRPPTRFVKALAATGLDDAFVHHINRDTSERYVVVIAEGSIQVFDHITGNEVAVASPGGLDYLSSPGSAYRAITVADYTFIVNTEVTVTLDDVAADETPPPVYQVWPGGNPRTGGPIEVVLPGDPYQYPPNPVAGTLTGTVQKFEDLPTPPIGLYKVAGSADSGFVSYYVRADGTVWDEAVAPGLKNSITATTMPHALVRQSDGTFVFAPFSWRPRQVGDTATNPAPPFVGRAIRDVFFWQNRLGFLVDESVVFSTAGDYGGFWRRTVLDYIDSDALSVAAATTDVAVLDYAIPFNDGIMLFSAQRQFSLSVGEAGLSPSSVQLNPVTSYLTSPGVRPAPLGTVVYFASDAGGYATVQEYTRLDGSDATDAAEITAHVPGLLPSGLSRLIPAPDIHAVIALASESTQRNMVYAYQFFWSGKQKLQSAWRAWDFGDAAAISGTFFDGSLHLVMKRGDVFSLETMDLRPQAVSVNQAHQIYLDRQVSLTGSYSPENNATTFTLPYAPNQDTFRIVQGIGAPRPESLLQIGGYTFPTDTTVTVPGNFSAGHVTVGEAYTTYLRFSRQFPLDWQSRPLTTGRLQLHTWSVNYTDTAFFQAEVQPYGPDAVLTDDDATIRIDFTGRLIGSVNYRLGEIAYRTGTFTFSVSGDASQAAVALSNSSPYASTWVSGEWEGLFFSRAM